MHRRTPAIFAVLALVLVLAGCVGTGADAPEDAPEATLAGTAGEPLPAPYPPITKGEADREATLGREVQGPFYAPTGTTWTVEIPATVLAIKGRLSWNEPSNDLGIEIAPGNRPFETHAARDPTVTSFRFKVHEPGAGDQTIRLLARGATVEDTVDLHLSWRLAPPGWIDVQPIKDMFRGEAIQRVGGSIAETYDLRLYTETGTISAEPAARTYLEARRWAIGYTAWGAEQEIKGASTTLSHGNGTLEGHYNAFGIDVGVDLTLKTPEGTGVHGSLEGRDARINLTGLRMIDDVQASTWSDIQGAILLDGGTLDANARYGALDLGLLPVSNSTVKLAAQENSTLRLRTGSSIGWDLAIHNETDAIITAEVPDASLTPTAHGYRLTTNKVDERALTVTGRIDFDGEALSLYSVP